MMRAPSLPVPVLLSPRELQVLRFAAEGLNREETAGRLGITANTVKAHRQAILHKLGAHNMAGAVGIWARETMVELLTGEGAQG